MRSYRAGFCCYQFFADQFSRSCCYRSVFRNFCNFFPLFRLRPAQLLGTLSNDSVDGVRTYLAGNAQNNNFVDSFCSFFLSLHPLWAYSPRLYNHFTQLLVYPVAFPKNCVCTAVLSRYLLVYAFLNMGLISNSSKIKKWFQWIVKEKCLVFLSEIWYLSIFIRFRYSIK